MRDTQNAKNLVLRYLEAWESAEHDRIDDVLDRFVNDDYRFRGVHPFNELSGVEEVSSVVWRPMRAAFTALQRRQDIFMAGQNRIDGTLWVTSMGKLMGLFDRAWLGIPPTGKIALIPYCEFHRVDAGQIAESAFFCDIVSVMKQAGLTPLPMQTVAEIVNPGPRTQDGLMYGPQEPAESRKTLDLIMRMCDDLVDKDGFQSSNSSLASTWHDGMIWFGPAGIGATYTIGRYQLQHQGPFREGLRNIVFNGHVLEHAEGGYGGWFGWPNLRTHQGDGFMGLPASERTTEMRVVDMYRREGDKLAENRVFIDLLPTCGCWGWMCWRGAPGFVDRNAASGPGSSRVSTTGRGSTTRMRRFPSSPWRTSRERPRLRPTHATTSRAAAGRRARARRSQGA